VQDNGEQPISLRRSLSIVSAALVLLALTACAALIWTTSTLRNINEATTQNLESVRLAEEAKIDLLLLARETDPLARKGLADDLTQKLHEASLQTTNDAERESVARARTEIEALLRSEKRSSTSAYAAVDALIFLNSRETSEAIRRARSYDKAADIFGASLGVLLVVFVGGFLLWLQRRAIRPIFSIGQAMIRFGQGNRESRAPEEGPAEIREMALRFNDMAAVLASQRRAQMTFLSGVAHDLKNPISVLKMSVMVIRSDDASPELVRDTIERVHRQISRLERMIGDLLDVTNIEAGRLEMKFGVEDVGNLTREAVDLFEGASGEHKIVLRVPEEPVMVPCDGVRVGQVVTNLVSNAIKYSPKDSTIEVSLEREGEEAVISVKDSGVGISKEDQKRLFEPFRRVGLSKESVPGVGLGLFVVKRIVEAHSGHIDVASEPGRGSTFRVFLPERS
jgi:two-component system sensor histidine kinase MtrB